MLHDNMFQLTEDEYDSLRFQIGTSNLKSQFASSKNGRGGRRYMPYAFTEHGVVMLSSILNSKIATVINMAVVKAFIDMRRYIANPVRKKLEDLEKVLMLHIDDTNLNFSKHAAAINKAIESLNRLIETTPKPKRRIGF